MSTGPFIISAAYDLTICVTDLSVENGINMTPNKFQMQSAQANRIIPFTDTRFIVASNPYIYIYDRTAKTSKHLQSFQGHQSNVTDLCFAGNNLFSSSEDKSWQKWEFGKQRPIKNISTGCCLNAICLIKEKTILLTGNDHGQIEAWDPNTCEKLATQKLGPHPVRSIAECGKNGPIVAGLQNGTAYLFTYNVEEKSMTITRTIEAHQNVLTRVAASPNGKYFATASADSTAIVWDVETGEMYYKLEDKAQTQWIWDVCFSADSTFVVTGGTDKFIRVWDLEKKTLKKTYEWHSKGVTCLTILN